MKIIVTACGLGSRFTKEGILTPKYKIIANEKSLFSWSMLSLKSLFNESFIFIFNKKTYDSDFVKNELKKLNIKNYKIIVLSRMTDGQASTAFKANRFMKSNDSVLIYNIDTHISPGVIKKSCLKNDGVISTANEKGSHWSFVKINKDGFAVDVSEKIRISRHASIGFYYFKLWSDFSYVHKNFKKEIIARYRESYICPMYKYIIEKDKKISILSLKKTDYVCLGTPDEVKSFDKNFLKNNR